MNDTRPTPETDYEEQIDNGDTKPLFVFCRKLERERDEARDLARELRDAHQSKGGAAMSNQPTPETDALAVVCYAEGGIDGSLGFRALPLNDARKLERERDELARWKREQMFVESQWDAQAVAKELGMPAGADIRKNILPAIQKLKRERDEAREELARMQGMAASVADIIAKRDAMIDAMVETHKLLLSIQLNDIFEDTMRSYARLAIEKLKPFIP